MIFGTLVNAGAVVIGGSIGLFLGSRIPTRYSTTFFQSIGLFTLVLGVSMAIKTNNPLLVVFSLILGGATGTWLNLQERVEKSAVFIQKRFNLKSGSFSEGFMTSFLMFCMGTMTILGAIEEGMGSPPKLLLIKSLMDGFSAIALSASLGIGVIFSAIPLLLYQGGISLIAYTVGESFSQVIVDEISATGGILLIGLGISILGIKKIEVMNLILALLFIIPLVYFFG
jgi:uncharacterized protein